MSHDDSPTVFNKKQSAVTNVADYASGRIINDVRCSTAELKSRSRVLSQQKFATTRDGVKHLKTKSNSVVTDSKRKAANRGASGAGKSLPYELWKQNMVTASETLDLN